MNTLPIIYIFIFSIISSSTFSREINHKTLQKMITNGKYPETKSPIPLRDESIDFNACLTVLMSSVNTFESKGEISVIVSDTPTHYARRIYTKDSEIYVACNKDSSKFTATTSLYK